jgi:hypothetical protein
MAKENPDAKRKAADIIGLHTSARQHAALFWMKERRPSGRSADRIQCGRFPHSVGWSITVTEHVPCFGRWTPVVGEKRQNTTAISTWPSFSSRR